MSFCLIICSLISLEDVASVDAGADVIEHAIVAVGDDGMALTFEFVKVIYHSASEEGFAVFKRGFVVYHFGSFGLDAFHHALNCALAEVV